MSRCFPYPPPGYVRNGASREALIDSIKLPRERENAKTERRKERKKEKKREKEKRKQKLGENCDGVEKKLNDVKSHKGESRVDLNGGHLKSSIENDSEQLERSGLTEEHEQPICSENPCYSSDGTQNSNKRKRHSLPSNGSCNHGNILRIRLPLQKHKEPDASLGKEQHCSIYGRTNLGVQQKYEFARVPSQEQCCSTSTGITIGPEEITPTPDKELLCSTSGRTEIFAQYGAGSGLGSKLFENGLQKAGSSYKALIENWVPPPLQSWRTDYNDQQWLFEKKPHDRQEAAKRLKASNDMPCHGSWFLSPHAQYLPEADIYALPYAIPF